MNEILAQAYGTREKLAAAQPQEKTAEAALLDELVKVAEAEGVDLNQLDDNDIAEILAGAMQAAGQEAAPAEKTASANDGELSPEDNAKLQEADFLGRVMAHAMFDEMSSIQNGGQEKTASPEEQEFLQAFEAMAVYKANEILRLSASKRPASTSRPRLRTRLRMRNSRPPSSSALASCWMRLVGTSTPSRKRWKVD